MTQSQLLLTKKSLLGAVAIKSGKRKLLQAITTPFSRHLPENSIFGHFSPFVIPPPLLLTKLLSQGAATMIYTEREQLQAITTPLFLPYASNSIFGHFWPFVFAHCKQLQF